MIVSIDRKDNAIQEFMRGNTNCLPIVVEPETSMKRATKGPRMRPTRESLPDSLPEISLRHGETLWVLAMLGFKGAATKSTFYEYIKSLRKLGSPFEGGKTAGARGASVTYSYCHMMELALVLTLRVYNIVPDSVLAQIIRHRTLLCRHYRRAYLERSTGIGAPAVIHARRDAPIHVRGAFLDLQLNFSGGRMTSFGTPKLIPPAQALAAFAAGNTAARAFLPISLSHLAENLVSTALRAPVIRRGSPPQSRSRSSRKYQSVART